MQDMARDPEPQPVALGRLTRLASDRPAGGEAAMIFTKA